MSPSIPVSRRAQSLGEEICNSLSHGAALVAAIGAAPFLILHATGEGDVARVVGASVFAATVILLYLASTLYHSLPHGKGKRIFRALDHAAIFLLIAGTYTPFTLGVLSGPWGWSLFGVVWGLATVGVLLKGLGRLGHPVLSTGLYVSMGWVVLVALKPLLENLPAAGLAWLLAGGLAYTAGVVFYAFDARLRYGHFIWHLFVLAGTTCHYTAVFLYAA